MRFWKWGWVAISLKQRRRWRQHGGVRTNAILTVTDAVSCNVNANCCCNCSSGCWAAHVGGCCQTSASTPLQVQSQRGKLCHSSWGRWCEVSECQAKRRVEEHHGKSHPIAGPNQLHHTADCDFKCALGAWLALSSSHNSQFSNREELCRIEKPPVAIRQKQNLGLSLMDLENCTA